MRSEDLALHWAQAPLPREQIALFSPTLEEPIGEDQPARLLDEILRGIDWSARATPCGDHRGRPPIQPRILAGIILYGLMRRFRSSRRWEYLCGQNLDFIWLAERHQPDHTTLSIFRKGSRPALKDLFRQVVGVRQFLLRGLENVRTEWRRLCTTYNSKKLLASLGALRARVAHWIAEPIS